MRRPLAAVVALALLLGACTSAPPLASFTGQTITVVAVGIAFQPNVIQLPAGRPLRIVLDNQDSGVPHDVHVFQGDTDYGTSSTVTGPGQTEVRFGPLTPGTYQFACTVHPAMTGTLTIVQP